MSSIVNHNTLKVFNTIFLVVSSSMLDISGIYQGVSFVTVYDKRSMIKVGLMVIPRKNPLASSAFHLLGTPQALGHKPSSMTNERYLPGRKALWKMGNIKKIQIPVKRLGFSGMYKGGRLFATLCKTRSMIKVGLTAIPRKNTQASSALPFSGHLTHWAINPAPSRKTGTLWDERSLEHGLIFKGYKSQLKV